MERREFLVRIGQSAITLPFVLQAIGCGDEDDPVAPSDPSVGFNVTSSSTSGHTHSVTFECQALNGGTGNFGSSSSSGHTHSISLSADEMIRILNGETISVASSLNGGHRHNWNVQKPANACT